MNLTRPAPLSIIGDMMPSHIAPSDPRASSALETFTDAPMPQGSRASVSVRRAFVAAGLALALFVGGAVAPSGAQAYKPQELNCSNSWDLVQSLLKRHISFRGLDSELRSRAIDAYIERIDPSKTLYLSSEIKSLRGQLTGVFFAVQNGECDLLDDIQTDLVKRYERMQKDVTEFVSREDYALDTDVRLILDPDKRGHPSNDEGRVKLLERLVHFQMSNYLSSDMEVDKAKEKLIHRYELMTKRAQELEPRDTYGNFLNAFASALDPHSAYYPPEADEDFQIQMSLSLDGIGVALSSKDGYSVVERIIPGGATDKTGALEPGDKIIAVAQAGEDPVDIVDMSLRDVVSMIRGERGTTVKLTILRKTDTTERFEVAIVRDKVTIEDAAATLDIREVEAGDKTRKFAVIDLPTFYGDADPSKRQSGRDVRDLLRQAREAKVDGVLLDLSRNGGGKLDSSREIAGLFIREGGVVAVKNVFSEVQVLDDPADDIVYDGPLVILTSRITASASEIVAGALQDYGRAIIVGDDHTFGKGTVQSYVNQPGRLGALKVTTALFFRPGGASTQHAGVAADIVLPSLFATDDLGERYTPYSLGSQKITPFLGKTQPASRFTFRSPAASSSEPTPWAPLSEGLMSELRGRSATRVAENEDFKKISERLAKLAEEDDVVHLAELLKEREEAEAESDDEADAGPDSKDGSKGADSDQKTDQSSGGSDAGSDAPKDQESKKLEESATPSDKSDAASPEGDAEKEDEPTPQELEALRILADLVELQETGRTSWPAPQSASRSELPSSQP